jgi:hypothetical protein
MPERERNDLLLDDRRKLAWHLRPPALARAQHLQTLTIDLHLPAVVGRPVHAHHSTGLPNADLAREREQPQAIAEQHVILRHADSSHFITWR